VKFSKKSCGQKNLKKCTDVAVHAMHGHQRATRALRSGGLRKRD
jgi:hypothetical protein